MSKVNVEEFLDEVNSELQASLAQALREVAPASVVDLRRLVAAFKREMTRRCEPWCELSDQSVR